VDAVFDTIKEQLKTGDKVQLVGFVSFEVKQREARVGRNPKTMEEIRIPARRVPVFRPGKELKESVM
jgi:DNA-binding protein HU-beta